MIELKNNNEWFDKLVSQFSSNCAIINEMDKISYSELDEKIDRLAFIYANNGINEGETIPLLFKNQYSFIITVYALWKIGAVPVPINRKLSENEIKHQINFLEVSFFISDLSKGIDFNDGVRTIDFKELNFVKNSKRISSKIKLTNIAVMMFTSGSSGVPKCVMLSFRNILSSVNALKTEIKCTSDDKCLVSLPFYHIGGFMIFIRALLTGAAIIIMNSYKEEDFERILKNQKPEYISLVPTQLQRLINKGVKPNSNLKALFLGGGPINKDLLEFALDNKWPVTPVYGSTETCSMVTIQKYSHLETSKAISLIALPGVEYYCVDENFKKVYKQNGEIVVKSDSVSLGYYKNNKATDLSFRDGFYLTNDIGSVDNEGRLNIVGRKDDIIICGGENISLKEVENKIICIEGISDAAVIGIPNNEWGTILAVLLESSLPKQKIIEELKKILPSFKIPQKIAIIEKLPRNEMGKIKKVEVEKLLTS